MFNHMVEHIADFDPPIDQPPDPAFDAVLNALADPTRRAILARLAGGERRVTEIAEDFPVSLNAISKHVKKLEASGLVRRRRSGRDHFLSADPAPIERAADWFDRQRRLWNARLDRLEALLEEEAK